jgi:dTDP-4-amino-4,6-dideoxygalactose transaminase
MKPEIVENRIPTFVSGGVPCSGAGADAAPRAWPFWKTIPRFDREYHAIDFASAVRAVTGSRSKKLTGLEDYFAGARGVHFSRSGKESLYLILRALKIPAGSRVGVPLYCCEAVFETIAAAGFRPLFLDIDLGNYAVSQQCVRQNREQLDALVVVHTFGYPVDIDRIRESLGGRDIPIIEDCAHSLFSDYKGVPTGSLTEASFMTFGVHKPAAAGGGGMAVVHDSSIESDLKELVISLKPDRPLQQIRHSLTCWARSFAYRRGVYGALLATAMNGRREADAARGGRARSSDNHVSMRAGKIRDVDQVLIGHRVSAFRGSLPALERNTARIRESLRGFPICIPDEPGYGRWNHFMLPARYLSAAQYRAGRRLLLQKRVDTAPLYRNCVRNARKYGYQGGCPQAELAAETVCTVPHYARLTDQEVEYVGSALRQSAQVS